MHTARDPLTGSEDTSGKLQRRGGTAKEGVIRGGRVEGVRGIPAARAYLLEYYLGKFVGPRIKEKKKIKPRGEAVARKKT